MTEMAANSFSPLIDSDFLRNSTGIGMMKVFVTGAAGFIGSTLAERLLAEGNQVVGWDNFSTGQLEFLTEAGQDNHFMLVKGDTLDLPGLTRAMAGCDVVFHLA